MPAYNFQTRFAPMVQSGAKLCTIRRIAARIGATAYLFTGMRTKACLRLGQGRIVMSPPITLGWKDNGAPRIKVGSQQLTVLTRASLAQADGFGSAREMVEWFEATYPPASDPGTGDRDVFSGFLIGWYLVEAVA